MCSQRIHSAVRMAFAKINAVAAAPRVGSSLEVIFKHAI